MIQEIINEKEVIFLSLTGSRLYGTFTESSDYDYRGMMIPGKEYFFGLKRIEQREFKEPDVVIYEIRKALNLMANANPNMIEQLFIPSSFWLKSSREWEMLVDNRHLFVSKKVKGSYIGYAIAQIKRMQRHRQWLREGPPHKPNRKEYGLPENDSSGIAKEQIGSILAVDDTYIDSKWKEIAKAEKRYKQDMDQFKQYMGWLENRNPNRAELEKNYGYDSKHAMHVVRLYRQGIQFLKMGKIDVVRTGIDADELIHIRNGGWTYNQLMDFVEHAEEEINKVFAESEIPDNADFEAISLLCCQLVESFLRD